MSAAVRRLVVSIHDVAPATLRECRALRALVDDTLGPVPVSLLVVPRYHGDPVWSASARGWLGWRADRGDEIVLHGLDHLDHRGADGGEFARLRSPAAAGGRIREALAILGDQGLTALGFVAPAYLHPSTLDVACDAAGLDWWATRGQLRRAGWMLALPSIGLGASTAARRALSPPAARIAAHALATAPAVRLDLHPADLRHARLAATVAPLLATLAGQGRTALRHRDLLDLHAPGGGRAPHRRVAAAPG